MVNAKAIGKNVDVLVMGDSAGGLPAALRAKENGAEKVLLIDKRPVLGGCAVSATGMFAIESPVQKRVGEHHSVDDCFNEYIRLQNWRCDARLVRKWFRTSGKVVEWLESKGAIFLTADTFIGGIKVDHNQRVLREDWTPINGLYGAGTGTGGWVNTGYGYPGTSFGYSMYSGYAAGGNAAEYVIGRAK